MGDKAEKCGHKHDPSGPIARRSLASSSLVLLPKGFVSLQFLDGQRRLQGRQGLLKVGRQDLDVRRSAFVIVNGRGLPRLRRLLFAAGEDAPLHGRGPGVRAEGIHVGAGESVGAHPRHARQVHVRTQLELTGQSLQNATKQKNIKQPVLGVRE
eukprot:scaffold178337_cov39-Prasinocladus_malaysianus.AAC.1